MMLRVWVGDVKGVGGCNLLSAVLVTLIQPQKSSAKVGAQSEQTDQTQQTHRGIPWKKNHGKTHETRRDERGGWKRGGWISFKSLGFCFVCFFVCFALSPPFLQPCAPPSPPYTPSHTSFG